MRPDDLVPAFETRFKRQAMMVEWPDADRPPAQIEVAFDRGAIWANGAEAPISEIELELKRGDARTLFELAQSMRELAGRCGCRPWTRRRAATHW